MGLLRLSELSGFAGLGQTDESSCGTKPGLGPGEKAMCCPDIGWVVYDSSESEYALCERAAGRSTSTAASAATTSSGLGPSPMAAVEEMAAKVAARREELEARREEIEQQRHEEQLQLMKLQMLAAQAEAKQRAADEKVASKRRAELAKIKAREEEETRRQTMKLVTLAGAIFAAYKLFR